MALMEQTAGTRNANAARQNAANVTTANTRPDWAERSMRVDPYSLPHRINVNAKAIRSASRVAVDITLDHRGAVIKRQLDCGLPVSMSLPARAFEGIAARTFCDDDGQTTVTLELLHADKALNVPLCACGSVEEAAADWHSWSRTLNLPMLMIDAEGQVKRVRDAGLVTGNDPAPRRLRTSPMRHRPRFLRRRKVGQVGPVVKLEAREIIART